MQLRAYGSKGTLSNVFERKPLLGKRIVGFTVGGFFLNCLYTWAVSPECDINSYMYSVDREERMKRYREIRRRCFGLITERFRDEKQAKLKQK